MPAKASRELCTFEKKLVMGATVIKIKNDTKAVAKKPLSSLQKKLLEGPLMTNEEYKEFKKNE